MDGETNTNEAIAKVAVLVISLIMVGFMAAIIFVPGAMRATGEIVKGTITSAQDALIPAISRIKLV